MSLFRPISVSFILGACICWSIGSVLVRRIMQNQPIQADMVTLQKPLASFPVLLVLVGVSITYSGSVGVSNQLFSCCSFSYRDLLYAVLNGFCLAMAWIFLYRTLMVSTASYITLMSMLTPVIVSLLALIFLGETIVWVQIIGALLMFLSGMLV